MVDYTRAIKRPFTDFKKLLMGIVLSIIPIVNLVAIGYQLKCAKTAMSKKFVLPEWEDYGDLFVKGLLMIVISGIYMLLPLVILVLAGGAAIISYLGGAAAGMEAAGMTAALAGAGIGMGLGLLLALIISYVLPVAILRYVETNRFGAAFSLGTVFRKAFHLDYLIVWISMILYSTILVAILSLVPYIGTLAASFITGVTSMTLFGELYAKLKE